MRKLMAPALALVGALAVSACQTSRQTGTLAGGAIGAAPARLFAAAGAAVALLDVDFPPPAGKPKRSAQMPFRFHAT